MSSLRCDAEFLEQLKVEIASLPSESPPDDDFPARRKMWELVQIRRNALIPETPNVNVTPHLISVTGGCKINVYRVCPNSLLSKSPSGRPAVLFAHGGGMILGTADYSVKRLAIMASKCNIQIFSVDYRLAPEWPHPAPAEDCFIALKWLINNAVQFDIDPSRIAVMGESAGGGLMAAAALMARDHGLQPPLARQILSSPMIDDRTIMGNPELEKFAVWKYDNNLDAWGAVLGGRDRVGAEDTDPYAAAARAKSVAGLPPTYVEVGGLDIFRDEAVQYARRIMDANIDCELHLYPGVGHSFEYIAPYASVSVRAVENVYAALRNI
jgi:acetyl esterase/lipase